MTRAEPARTQETSQATPSGVQDPVAHLGTYRPGHIGLTGRIPSHQNGLHAEFLSQAPGNDGIPLRIPVLAGIAGCHHQAATGSVEAEEEVPLILFFPFRQGEAVLQGFRLDADVV
jgi:hypothetical protein